MGLVTRGVSVVGGRRVIVLLGGVLLVSATGWAVSQISQGTPLADGFIKFILVGGPGSVLLYCGYRLPQSDIHPELYPRIAAWCLIGLGVLLGVIILYDLQLAAGIEHWVLATLISTGYGSVGGLGIGLHDARARSRAREAEQHSAELARQNERLESFAGMLAHELRNPLAIAQIYHPQEQPQNEDAAKEVESALARIEEMIDILLVTVRGSEVTIDYEPVRIANIATDAWANLSAADTGNLVVETEQTIQADPIHLEHLLRNLFRNSLEHGGKGVTVRVGDLRDGFFIEDDGPGIPEDAREDVVKAGFTTKADGIGLGLTFIAQLVDTYDWHYTITESEAGGARFEFTDVSRVSPAEELQQT